MENIEIASNATRNENIDSLNDAKGAKSLPWNFSNT